MSDGIDDGGIEQRAVADSIEILDSQTDLYEGDYDLRIRLGSETFDLTISAPDMDFRVALEKAKLAGRFFPEEGSA